MSAELRRVLDRHRPVRRFGEPPSRRTNFAGPAPVSGILAVSMAVMGALSSLGRLIRRAGPPPAHVLEAYAHEVIPVLDRAEWLYQYWLEQSMLFTDSEKLGNVAAIH